VKELLMKGLAHEDPIHLLHTVERICSPMYDNKPSPATAAYKKDKETVKVLVKQLKAMEEQKNALFAQLSEDDQALPRSLPLCPSPCAAPLPLSPCRPSAPPSPPLPLPSRAREIRRCWRTRRAWRASSRRDSCRWRR
jgi:hypothetical protein